MDCGHPMAARRITVQAVGPRAEDGECVVIGCFYCGDPILIDRTNRRRVRFLDDLGRSRPELDHITPLFWDGPHTTDNLVPACLKCNRSKGPRRLALA